MLMSMRPLAVLALMFALVLLATVFSASLRGDSAPPLATETFGSPAFSFETASTTAARSRGLSGRADIPANYGMLFVFETPGRYGFWMKNMLAPIDIVWLARDGTVLGVEPSVGPETYPQHFYPPEPVWFVLETRAGEAEAQGWVVGSRISLPF